jgi:hypothetical protein
MQGLLSMNESLWPLDYLANAARLEQTETRATNDENE